MSHLVPTMEYGENENDLIPDVDADGESLSVEETCEACDGTGYMTIGEFDDIREVKCPHKIIEEWEVEGNALVKEAKEQNNG